MKANVSTFLLTVCCICLTFYLHKKDVGQSGRMIWKKLKIWLLLICCLSLDSGGLILTKSRFQNVKVLKHFWKSTGLCPASSPELRTNFLLSNDEKLNLDYIGALPNKGIKFIRIHWLLDLVTISLTQSKEPIFHLENLDLLIDRLYRNELYPTFELMGNPSNYFHDFKIQSIYWTSLIYKIIKHYSDLYGANYVQEWRFELTNEPDLKQYNIYNFTLDQYIDYFRASEKAVPNLSGPAGLFRKKKSHPLCWGLLNYCNSNPCKLNTITFHRKGGEVGSQVVKEGVDLISDLVLEFPNLKGASFGNDESDIMTGWLIPKEWRADVRYAALVVQVIVGHIEEMFVKSNISFEVLSNDNAFLSFYPNFFTQRTLLARFQMNNTIPNHVQFFRKPVYSVMGMLSLLGDKLLDIQYNPEEKGFSFVMTSHKHQRTFLGVITNDRVDNDTYNKSYADINVKIALGNMTLSGIGVGYLMDNDMSNPYQVWREGGSPLFPGLALRRKMRKAEGFERIFIRKIKPYQKHLKLSVRKALVPSIFTVNVCYEGTAQPGKVVDLHYANVTHGEILLFWKDNLVKSRCILTYSVEFKKRGDTIFHKLNSKDTIFLSYYHDGIGRKGFKIGIVGEYRVAAVDYWNRYGPYSDVLTL